MKRVICSRFVIILLCVLATFTYGSVSVYAEPESAEITVENLRKLIRFSEDATSAKESADTMAEGVNASDGNGEVGTDGAFWAKTLGDVSTLAENTSESFAGYIVVLKDESSSEVKASMYDNAALIDDSKACDLCSDKMYSVDSLETLADLMIDSKTELDDIRFIEPDYYEQIEGYTPNDVKYDEYEKWWAEMIGMPEVWEHYKGGSPLTVAVIDTGLSGSGANPTHPKHEDIDYSKVLTGKNTNTDSTIGYSSDYTDGDHTHGTAVAGTICAVMDNNIGLAGLASNVKILPIKAFNSSGGGKKEYSLAGVNYAISQGVDIINMSYSSSGGEQGDAYSLAIDEATSKGIICVAAAGNESITGYRYPASYDNVISVGAVDRNGQRASSSNINDKVDVTAPGVSLGVLNNSGGYSFTGGNSFSTGIVSAYAVMIKSLIPSATHDTVMEYIKTMSRDSGDDGYDKEYGWGVVDFASTYENITGSKLPDYTVTYYDEKHPESASKVSVKKGAKLTKPENPVCEGFNFLGWFMDEECSYDGKWDFDADIVNNSMTLYAGWSEKPKIEVYESVNDYLSNLDYEIDEDEILAAVEITKEDEELAAEGKYIQLELVIRDVELDTDEDKSEDVDSLLRKVNKDGYSPHTVIDFNLDKIVIKDDEELSRTRVDKFVRPIKINIAIPEELINKLKDGSGENDSDDSFVEEVRKDNERVIALYSNENGSIKQIATASSDAKSISIYAEGSAMYALVYKDSKKEDPEPDPEDDTEIIEYIDYDTYKSSLPGGIVCAGGVNDSRGYFDLKVHRMSDRDRNNQAAVAFDYYSKYLKKQGHNFEIIASAGLYPRRELYSNEQGMNISLSWKCLNKQYSGEVYAVCYSHEDGVYIIKGFVDENGTANFGDYLLREEVLVTIFR